MFNILDECKRFCQSTSLKGVPRILKTKSLGLRSMWAVAVFTFLAVSGLQAYNLIVEYLQYPTVTVVREKGFNMTHSTEVIMPDVLVCNLNPFAYTVTKHNNKHIPSLEDFYNHVMHVTQCIGNCTQQQIKLMLQIRDDLLTYTGYYQYIGRDGITQVSHSKDGFIVSCQLDILDGMSIGRVPCDETVRITHVINSVYYNCHALQIIKQSIRKLILGFTITLFLDNFDMSHTSYLTIDSESSQATGALVTLYRPGTPPLIRRNGILLSPGTLTDVKFQIENRKRLHQPHGVCSGVNYMSDMTNYTKFTANNMDLCLSFCLEKRMEDMCGCIDVLSLHVRHNRASHIPFCGCLMSRASDFFGRYMCAKTKRTLVLMTDCLNKCPLPCSELFYIFKTSAAGWPGVALSEAFYKANINDRPYAWRFAHYQNISNENKSSATKAIEQNFLRFTVQLVSNRYIEFSDEGKFNLTILVSQLGGSLNLWSGITMVVIVEFLEFFLRLLSPKELSSHVVKRDTSLSNVSTTTINSNF